MATEQDGGRYDSVPLEEQGTTVSIEPLEIDATDEMLSLSSEEATTRDVPILSLTDPWLLSVVITCFLLIPTLLTFMILVRELIGRSWPTTVFAFHLLFAVWAALTLVPSTATGIRPSVCRRLIPSMIDMILFASIYVIVCNMFIVELFTDVDGTPIVEYRTYQSRFEYLKLSGFTIVLLRFCVETGSLCFIWFNRRYRDVSDDYQLPRMFGTLLAWTDHADASFSIANKRRFVTWIRFFLWFLLGVSIVLCIICEVSVMVHVVPWSAPQQYGPQCDPLDTTECTLPFPSFHHLTRDNTTDTGWRLALKGDALPPLKGDVWLDPTFMNEQLDGFSTMAPMLFYMDGLKEAQETGTSEIRLQGPESIELSVTNRSITLLIDVEERTLVPHSAEIDYLDSERPLVMVFPAKPLNHNKHYALAVIESTDVNGNRLPPTPGMQSLLSGQDDDRYQERRARYENLLIPALADAAPWFSYEEDPESLQLLFDFHTISTKSQLGPIRAVRDAAMVFIDSPEWEWSEHAREIRIDEGSCAREDSSLVARTVHAELDVPWFLKGGFGPGHRDATLSADAISSGKPVGIGVAKFSVHIPCSLRASAMKGANPRDLRAFVEYGHGLFYNRAEASDGWLLEVANANGYIITAMDWRGMSSFDLLTVVKVLMSTPKTFEAVRDNLIQGYANKLALQHFTKHGLLDTDWITFETGKNQRSKILLHQGMPPPSVFYGISQGGILGAGYAVLSGTTGLIDRAVLGVPGTPFALILTRSLDFNGYDTILLLNFYNNRHVRILLSLVQLAWDSVEGSGLLAPPVEEPYPTMLLQAGLGDVEVPTVACEALARGLGAATLPNSPRNIFNIPIADFTDIQLSDSESPPAILTELKYVKEYEELPKGDRTRHFNSVHFCVRQDPNLIVQMTMFINDGTIIDPCETDGCIRDHVTCGVAK